MADVLVAMKVDVICNCCHMQLWPPQHRWDFLYTLRFFVAHRMEIETTIFNFRLSISFKIGILIPNNILKELSYN